MKLSVKVTASAGEALVEKIDETSFHVWVRQAPVDGQANAAVCRALAKYFDVAPSRVSVVRGHTSRNKIIEIL